VTNGNGVATGKCVNSTLNETVGEVCEIHAWCPVEWIKIPSNDSYVASLGASENFTVFIKNNIEFPKFGVQRRNIIGFDNDTDLSNCRFDPLHPKNKLCPIFDLGTITRLAGVESYSELHDSGGVIQIIINWDCNLDFAVEDCLPEYSFQRLDRGDFKISKGFNFRYAEHYFLQNANQTTLTMARTLYKATGIRFIVTVQGRAGQLAAVPTILNLASGLALLSIVS